MKKQLIHVGAVVALCLMGCLPQGTAQAGALLSVDAVGWNSISQGTNATTLRDIGQLPSSKVVFGLMLDKLAGTPARIWKGQIPAEASPHAELIRPVLKDLVVYPSLIQIEGTTDQPAIVAAAQVPDREAKLWISNLRQLATAWKLGTPADVQDARGEGWETTLPHSKAVLGVRHWQGWAILVAGVNTAPVLEKVAARLQSAPQAKAGEDGPLVRLEADWPRLKAWTPVVADYPLLPMTLTMEGEGAYVRTLATFQSGSPLNLTYEPWQIPTNFMSDPLVSFTAARGVRPLLSPMKLVHDVGMNPVPNQLFLWGQKILNGQTMLAIPMKDADKQMAIIQPKLPLLMADLLDQHLPGQIYWLSNQFEMVWRGLPVIVPFAKAVETNQQPFVVAGLIPFVIKTNPPPAELFQELRRSDDILYYDWEITQDRLIHNRHYYHMMDIFAKRQTIPTKSPTFAWLQDVHPKLGNAITVVRHSQPQTMQANRKSHLGFTGYELVTFMRWLHSDGFPLAFPSQPAIVMPENIKAQQGKGAKRPGSRP